MTKRPLFSIAVFLVLGEFLAAWNGKMAFGWIAGICVPVILFYWKKEKTKYRKTAGMRLLLAGWCGCLMYLQAARPDALMEYCTRTEKAPNVWAEGIVERVEEQEYNIRIYLKNADIWIDEIRYENQGIIVVTKDADLKTGNRIGVQGELKLFEQKTNPGVFDLRQYYRALGYGYRMNCKELIVLDKRYDHLKEEIRSLRRIMSQNIDRTANEKDAGILKAVFLGEASAADETIRQLYESQGIAHLLSVSGLHISMIGMLVNSLLRRITGSYAAGGVLGGIVVILYGMLSGGSLSAERSVLMYLIGLFGAWRGRVYDMQTALGAAALAMVSDNPLVILQSSFQLSFSAVLGLCMMTDTWKAFLLREDRPGILPLLSLQNMMLPALLFSFYEQSLFSMLVNQLILPFGGVLIMCAAGCACCGGILMPFGRIMATAGHGVLKYYETVCSIFAAVPGGTLVSGKPQVWRIFIYLLMMGGISAAASCVRKRKKIQMSYETIPQYWKRRCFLVNLCAGFTVCFASWFLRAEPVRKPEITMLDVGQGDCFLIRFPGGIDILSDCGSSSEDKLAEYILEPVLLSKGISSLDAVVLSHADEDHINGVLELIERGNIGIRQIFLPDYNDCEKDFSEVIRMASQEDIPCVLWSEGHVLEAGEAEFVCLHPVKGIRYKDINNASLVYRLTYGEFDMLFTGDIGSEAETGIQSGKTDVLKAAHHGSKYSSSEKWLKTLSPRAVLISCGKDNSYGHPHKETLKRLEDIGADYYITAETGATILRFDKNTFEISRFEE